MMLKKMCLLLVLLLVCVSPVFASDSVIRDVVDDMESMFRDDIVGVDESNPFLYGIFILAFLMMFAIIFTGDIVFVLVVVFLTITTLSIPSIGLLPLWLGLVVGMIFALLAGIGIIVKLFGQ